MDPVVLIPARLASSRFPEKMLADVGGEPLIKRVYNECVKTGYKTIVLTDSNKIADVVPSVMTPESCQNGTERCNWYINNVANPYGHIVNVQGDMPDVRAEMIIRVAAMLQNGADVSTLYTDMPEEQQNDPSSVKLVHNDRTARWFCRGITGYGDWHLGIYGYKRNALSIYSRLKQYKEEDIEKLEQLRWLQNEINIRVSHVEFNGTEINTQEDLFKWQSTQTN